MPEGRASYGGSNDSSHEFNNLWRELEREGFGFRAWSFRYAFKSKFSKTDFCLNQIWDFCFKKKEHSILGFEA